MSTETREQLVTTRPMPASAEDIFDVLADPGQHGAIDGTGWVGAQRSAGTLHAVGDVFEMDMYHEGAGGAYVMRNKVIAHDRPKAISWLPIGQGPDGQWAPGGWTWRYDLEPVEDGTRVTLSYDWSEVPQFLRDHIGFPPFPMSHLENSLANLERLAAH